MQHREAAVRITQFTENLTHEMSNLMGHLYQYSKKGNISEQEFNHYLERTRHLVDIVLTDLADPCYENFPDLRPACCGCGDDAPEETE